MDQKIKIFVDSDVIIAASLSHSGASYFLLHKTDLELYVSNWSLSEMIDVAKRLKIKTGPLTSFVKRRFRRVNLDQGPKVIAGKFGKYTNDPDDIHVIVGAVGAGADFLLTYNMKDYKIDKIKKDLNLICLTPGQFLQYLRSL